MDTIKGVVENVETVFGESIVARDESLVVLATTPGLGPPCMCWLQKAARSALTGATAEAQGYYHYCLGVDVSSTAAVAAYFANITAAAEPISFLQVGLAGDRRACTWCPCIPSAGAGRQAPLASPPLPLQHVPCARSARAACIPLACMTHGYALGPPHDGPTDTAPPPPVSNSSIMHAPCQCTIITCRACRASSPTWRRRSSADSSVATTLSPASTCAASSASPEVRPGVHTSLDRVGRNG